MLTFVKDYRSFVQPQVLVVQHCALDFVSSHLNAALLTVFFVFCSSTAIIKPAHVNVYFFSFTSSNLQQASRVSFFFFFFFFYVSCGSRSPAAEFSSNQNDGRAPFKNRGRCLEKGFPGHFFALSDIISDLHWMRARSTSFHTRGRPLSEFCQLCHPCAIL